MVAAIVAWRPAAAPFLAMLGSVFQSTTITHSVTTDAAVLLGVVVGAGIAAWRSGTRPMVPRPVAAMLLVLDLALLLAMARASPGASAEAATAATAFFVLRTALVVTVVAILPRQPLSRWLAALALAGSVLGGLRLAEIAGAPVGDALAPLGVRLLGDYGDLGSWNVFAILMLVSVAGSAVLIRAGGHRWVPVLILAMLIEDVAMATATSRTAAVTYVAVALALLVTTRATRHRALVIGLIGLYGLASLIPFASLANKPVVVAVARPADLGAVAATVTQAQDLPVSTGPVTGPTPEPTPRPTPIPVPRLHPDWRVVLDHPYYRVRQTISSPTFRPGADQLLFMARSGSRQGAATLHVAVNNVEAGQLSQSEIGGPFRWIQVSVPARARTPGSVLIDFWVTGPVDSQANFFAVAGTYATAAGYERAGLSVDGGPYSVDDVSSDAGRQYGLLLAFLDEVPRLEPLATPAATATIDPSIGDRLTLWSTALQILRQHPLTGTGFYTFGLERPAYETRPLLYPYANAHSNYFEFLADSGLLGGLAFGALVLALLLTAARRLRSTTGAAFAAVALAVALSSITQTWIADSRAYLPLLLLACLAGQPEVAPAAERSGARSGRPVPT